MSGFKNCSLTEFKVGMQFVYNDAPYTVVAVRDDGAALTDVGTWCHQNIIPNSTLDLDSIWVGREYRAKNDLHHTVKVIMVSDDLIAFEGLVRAHLREAWMRGSFRLYYEPLPLTPEPPAEPWTPKVGEVADWVVPGEGNCGRFYVMHIENDWAMLWDGTDAHACEASELGRPLPAEPPVKVGEVVMVVSRAMYYYGCVCSIEPAQRHFVMQCVNSKYGFEWDEVTITHFVEEKR